MNILLILVLSILVTAAVNAHGDGTLWASRKASRSAASTRVRRDPGTRTRESSPRARACHNRRGLRPLYAVAGYVVTSVFFVFFGPFFRPFVWPGAATET